MCGIVGYIGNKQAHQVLIKGLKRLEYRGYDSSGIALITKNSKIEVFKKQGKVVEMENLVSAAEPKSNIGIGHTRWATHGPQTMLILTHTILIQSVLQLFIMVL